MKLLWNCHSFKVLYQFRRFFYIWKVIMLKRYKWQFLKKICYFVNAPTLVAVVWVVFSCVYVCVCLLLIVLRDRQQHLFNWWAVVCAVSVINNRSIPQHLFIKVCFLCFFCGCVFFVIGFVDYIVQIDWAYLYLHMWIIFIVNLLMLKLSFT